MYLYILVLVYVFTLVYKINEMKKKVEMFKLGRFCVYYIVLFFFSYLYVITFSAIIFHKRYISDIEHQNCYVNNRFRKIDCSRAAVVSMRS